MIDDTLKKLISGTALSQQETYLIFREIAQDGLTASQVAGLLIALRIKGETAEEIAGAAQAIREKVTPIKVSRSPLVDTCGTGGDGQNTFNISTAAAFVIAGAGTAVAKHGNRAVSSQCGSADVLKALGANVDASDERVAECINSLGVGFMFAPKLHPAFRSVAAIRRELGVRTIFNLLGPLTNPAGATRQVIGVFSSRYVPIVGGALALLGTEHVWVVHGEGQDEVSVTGETEICEVLGGHLNLFRITPEEMGLGRWQVSDLKGGIAAYNAQIIRDVFTGQKGAPRDAVLANAGAGLLVGANASSLREGIAMAAESIRSGGATDKLDALIELSNRGEGASAQ